MRTVEYTGVPIACKHGGRLCPFRGLWAWLLGMLGANNGARGSKNCARGLWPSQRAAARRCVCDRGSCAWATSAMILLMIASPKESKFLAIMTNAPGPPMTLLR
jgi:hypothetical protein